MRNRRLFLMALALGWMCPGWTATLTGGTLHGGSMQAVAGNETRTVTAQTGGAYKARVTFVVEDAVQQSGLTNDIYVLPSTGDVVDTNALAVLRINRNASDASYVTLSYRNVSGYTTLQAALPRRGRQVWDMAMDLDADTYDLYCNGMLWERGITSPNGAGEISRVALVSAAGAPPIVWRVEATPAFAVTDGDQTLFTQDFTTGTDAIEDTTPDSQTRLVNAQKWLLPANTTNLGGFDLSANGLVADAAKKCIAMQRMAREGIWDVAFTEPAAGETYVGILLNGYEGLGTGLGLEDAVYLVRYYSGATAGQELRLFLGESTVLASGDGTTGDVSYGAGQTHTLRVEKRGRFFWVSMDGQLQLGPHKLSTLATGARGLLGEEQNGLYVDTNLGNSLITSLTVTGPLPHILSTVTIGSTTTSLIPGLVAEMYRGDSGDPTQDILFGHGLQFNHRAQREPIENNTSRLKTLHAATNVLVEYMDSMIFDETADAANGYGGSAEIWITRSWRGIWVFERMYITGVSVNIAADNDWHPVVASSGVRMVGASGTPSSVAVGTFHDWTTRIATAAPPMGFQVLATFASGFPVRVTSAFQSWRNIAQLSLTSKYKGNGDEISTAYTVKIADLTNHANHDFVRAYMIESGSSLTLANAVLTAYRDDVQTPAALASFTKGSLNTAVFGDSNADGFNERFGWYEITADGGGEAAFTYTTSTTRYYPMFRIRDWVSSQTAVTIGGVLGAAGVDYLLDDLSSGEMLLQLLSAPGVNTTIAIE